MKDFFAYLFIIVLSLFFYSATLRGVAGNPAPSDFKENLDRPTMPFELSPERGRFANILALGEWGRYDLGQELADAVYPDVGFYDGKFYSFFAPGMAYLGLPFYLLGRNFNLSQVFTYGFVSLISLLAMFFLYKIGRRVFTLPVWAALFAVLVFAFGTTAWSYAVTLYQHHLTVFFIFSGFYAAWKYRQGEKFSWAWGVWVWLSYALAIFVDYPNAVLMLPVMIYFFVVSFQVVTAEQKYKISFRPAFLATAICFLAVISLHGYHNQKNFGSWRSLSGELPAYREIQDKGLLLQADSAAAITGLAEQKNVAGFFGEMNVPYNFYILTVSSERGLLFFSPVLLLAFWGMRKLRRRVTLEAGVLLLLLGVNVFLYSSWVDPWGGWAYGPRYLIPSMAVLALFSAFWISQVGRDHWKKILAFVLLSYSSAIALLGALTSNAVPPKLEAVNLPLQYYNFFYNIFLLNQNKGGSFFYNTYAARYVSLPGLYLILYAVLLAAMLFVLFILPRMESKKEKF